MKFMQVTFKFKIINSEKLLFSFFFLTMPKKLPRRSTFLPSLSIRIIEITEPEVAYTTKLRQIYNNLQINLEKNTKELSQRQLPNKLHIPTHVFPIFDDTPKLSKVAEEK